MAKLTSKARKKLPSSSFALPGKGEGKGGKGRGSFPIPDAEHGRKALQLMTHKSPATQAKIRAKVKAKFPGIGKSK